MEGVGSKIWEDFLHELEKATKVAKEKTDKFSQKLGEIVFIDIHLYKKPVEDIPYHYTPVMEITGIMGTGEMTEKVMLLLERDLPLKGDSPIQLIDKFLDMLEEGINIIS